MKTNQIDILLIDDDPSVYDLISESLAEQNGQVEVNLRYESEFKDGMDLDYDMFVIDDLFGGVSKSVNIVTRIKLENQTAKIFVISGQASDATLRQLINLNIDGFIDKDTMEIEALIKAIESITLFRDQVSRLNSKLEKLFDIQKKT